MERAFGILEASEGTLWKAGEEQSLGEYAWNPHPSFAGVALKHALKGEDTRGVLSFHFVRVDSEKVLELHEHEKQCEIHEVLQGSGRGVVGAKEIPYGPGTMVLIPRGVPHAVKAGEEGLLIRATFFPALV
ncbi:MAG TPA: cupin domain-containing protein [Synergistaceae bacterium]|nr:cupin domain-containing protein [Synergistaceae bacterium]HPJ26308.1 cupin domain-containing protein [Synergistaceae bacterium]HPQ37403.1 cupin domain-containing protein [Synergistaceae bacterium]